MVLLFTVYTKLVIAACALTKHLNFIYFSRLLTFQVGTPSKIIHTINCLTYAKVINFFYKRFIQSYNSKLFFCYNSSASFVLIYCWTTYFLKFSFSNCLSNVFFKAIITKRMKALSKNVEIFFL